MRYPKHIILDLTTTREKKQINVEHIENLSDTNFELPLSVDSFTKYSNFICPTSTSSIESKIDRISYFPSSLFEVHLLRKEKLYTKLKYSRCPQYDIVSGGFAALLAGFIGFLISEKFGIELTDSADFYNAFMYGVFAVISFRPLIYIYSKDTPLYNPLSLKYLFLFVHNVFIISIKEVFKFWTWLYKFLRK